MNILFATTVGSMADCVAAGDFNAGTRNQLVTRFGIKTLVQFFMKKSVAFE